MRGGSQHQRVREADDPVLRPEHVHLRRGAQDGDGRDEAAGQGQCRREERHLPGGREVLRRRPLSPPREVGANGHRDQENGGQHRVLLPTKQGVQVGQTAERPLVGGGGHGSLGGGGGGSVRVPLPTTRPFCSSHLTVGTAKKTS